MDPIRLPANQPPRFYRGGAAIAELRGKPATDASVPEDWVASTTTLFGADTAGLTRLDDGTLLRDAIAADPDSFLGPAHTARAGADPGLLVKLLDAGQRLPVHAHPDRDFARSHLGCPYGKTEAWVILGVRGAQPQVHLGFVSDVERDTLRRWVAAQDTVSMLAAMHALPVEPGDAVLVPAGTPHAIGEGVLIVELQEPTDFSVLMEWEGFDLDGAAEGHLGLGFDVALECVDRTGRARDALEELRARRPDATSAPGRETLLPAAADPYFRADRLRPQPELRLESGYAILVVAGGSGTLAAGEASWELSRGDAILVPWAAGETRLSGDLDIIRCRPPAPFDMVQRRSNGV